MKTETRRQKPALDDKYLRQWRRTMPFHLPPKWYRETTEELVDQLEKELGKLTAETAWRYMYVLVGWFQSVDGQRLLRAGRESGTVVESRVLRNPGPAVNVPDRPRGQAQ